MIQWTRNELARIGSADELEIAALRPDGTLRYPVTIWVVPHGDDLYVRSVNGRGAAWFRGTQARHQGRIRSVPQCGFSRPIVAIRPDLGGASPTPSRVGPGAGGVAGRD